MAEAQQDELSARTAWIQAMQAYAARLDRFKVTLGLPADAKVELNRDELRQLATAAQERLQGVGGTVIAEGPVPPADAPVELVPPGKEGAGPLEMDDAKAVTISLDRRLDLRMLRDQVEDAQRAVVVAADALRPGLNLVTRYETGDRRGALSGAMPDGELRLQHGSYRAGFDLSLPWNKTRARVGYRNSLIALEQAVRDFQDLEDQVKLQVRDSLRRLTLARQSHAIQGRAVELAERRVRSTDLLLQAGRAQIRDLLFAQRDLLRTQNDLTAALISYRVTELEVQRDMDVLEVTDEGLWQEYIPRDEP
jgi:outer membrane protein TolC